MKTYRKDFKNYLSDLARRQPSPGGGSAVCLILCLGISLIEKAANYSLAIKPRNSPQIRKNKEIRRALRNLSRLKKEIYPCIDKDARLFSRIMKAKPAAKTRLLKESQSLITYIGEASHKVFSLSGALESTIKRSIISDFRIGLNMARVALSGCVANLEANRKMFGLKSAHIRIFRNYLKSWQKF